MYSQYVYGSLLAVGLISLVIWLLVLALVVFLMRMPIYHPFMIYMFYHFVGFILRPLTVYYESYSFIWQRIMYTPSEEYIWIMGFTLNLALIGALCGLMWCHGLVRLPAIPPTRFIINRPAVFFVAAILIGAAGLYSTYIAYGSAGLEQVNAFDTEIDADGGQRLVGVSGYALALQEALPILCIILLMSGVPTVISYSATALFVIMRLYVGAQRISFVVVIAAAALDRLIQKKMRYPSLMAVVLLVVGYSIFDIVGSDRYALRRVFLEGASITEIWDAYVDKKSQTQSTSMDIVEFEAATAAIYIIDNLSGYSYGTQYLRIFIWPSPRQLWPDKPIFTSTVILKNYGYNFLSMTHSLYADLYMAFGYPAVFFGMFFWGWLMGRMYRMGVTTQSAASYAFFWIFLIYMKTVLRDGGVTFAYFWALSFVFAAIFVMAGGMTLKRGDTPAPARKRATSQYGNRAVPQIRQPPAE